MNRLDVYLRSIDSSGRADPQRRGADVPAGRRRAGGRRSPVLTTLTGPRAGVAVERRLDRPPAEPREVARAGCVDAYLGTIGPIATRSGRSFEVAAGRRRIG